MMHLFSKLRKHIGGENTHVTFEWNQIDDNIFVGTNMCCQMHFEEALLKRGVKLDVSMEKEEIDMAQGIESFLWLPTKDHEAPTLEQLELGSQTIDKAIKIGYKVYIHCKNGHGRGPTMAAAYYIHTGLSVADAVHKVQKGRPETHIEEVQLERLHDLYRK